MPYLAAMCVGLALTLALAAHGAELRDTFADTWVATDALGRTVPTGREVGPLRSDRTVGMFSELHDRLSGPETPIGAGYKTLEQMTIEVMRPMLKDWLDTHLPGMVERLVQEEIERMVHRATQPRR